MGCSSSKAGVTYNVSAASKSLAEDSDNEGSPAFRENAKNFDAWAACENAEEEKFLEEEEKDGDVDALLHKAFPQPSVRHKSNFSSTAYWQAKRDALPQPDEPPRFKLSEPWTLQQASALYRYLCSPNAEPLAHRDVYSVLIAAFEAFEERQV